MGQGAEAAGRVRRRRRSLQPVREWWNSDGLHYSTPREHLFEQLGLSKTSLEALTAGEPVTVGKGGVLWMRENPDRLAADPQGDERLIQVVKQEAAQARLPWRESNYLLLRRGPYIVAAGLDESVGGDPKELHGKFINLFDSELRVRQTVSLTPGSRFFLMDLDSVGGGEARVLASACKALPVKRESASLTLAVEGVAGTPAVVLLHAPKPPRSVTLAGENLEKFQYSAEDQLLWIRFENESRPRELRLEF